MNILKRIGLVTIFVLAVAICAEAQNVTVNPGGGTYATLADALQAINVGTHTGAITVSVVGDTTETTTAFLNASGTGAASYTSVSITPSGGPRTISGNFAGAVLRLNGADNVTIDGRIGGVGRNLTISNATTTAASAAIWISSMGVGAGATGNIIRNLEVAAGVTNTNANATFGIIMSGTTISATAAGGPDNDNNQFIFNRVIRARYGILTRGESATNLNQNTVIDDNIIGPSAFGPDQIGKAGIIAIFENNCNINRNTVQFVGGLFANTTAGADRYGIGLGGESWATTPVNTTNTNFTVTRNLIHDVIEERTFSAVGIASNTTNGGLATNNLIANNMIYNVRANGTAGDQSVGIGVSGGDSDKVVFNSISMTGDLDPAGTTTSTVSSLGARVAGTPTNLTFKNNIIYVDFSSNTATLRHYVIDTPASYAWGTGGSDNNVYFYNTATTQMAFGGLGTTTPYTLVPNLATWRTSFTPNQDLNSRFSDPKFVSRTADLHIQMGVPTPVEGAGMPIAGITNDFDNDTRNVTTPDIGADEGSFMALPANDIAANSILVPIPGSIVPTGTTVSPQASFFNTGTATQTNVSVQFGITGPGGYAYSNMQTIATIAPFDVVTVTFAAAPAFTTPGIYNLTATNLFADSNTGNDTVIGSFEARAPLSGSYNVGAGGDFASLTNAGGIFESLNVVGASGNVTINITSDLTAETGAVGLSQLAGGFSVTIKPSGGARIISGTSATSNALINFNGADNVTIDGSLGGMLIGGTDRSLTINNNQPTTTTVIWIKSIGANGSTNNTIKNCIINGGPGPNSTTTAGILSGSGVTLGNDAEAPNSNNTIQNNWIYRVQNSMYLRGGAGANIDSNWTVVGNELGSSVFNDNNVFRGMLIGNSQNFTVAGNIVHGVRSTTTTAAAMSGIQIALVVNNGMVANNIISDIKNVSATGTGAHGVSFISTSTTSNVTVANNFVSDITGLGSATLASNGYGIFVNAGGGYKIYHNSVNVNTNQGSGTTGAILVTSAVTTAGGLDIRNNVFANTQTSGATRYAIYSAAANTVYSSINYNDYFSAGTLGFLGSARVTLADWQTATGQDANSQAIDPMFVSSSNLHLQMGSPMINTGTVIAGITTDIDGQTRDAMPDIGADEFVALPAFASISGRVLSSDGNGIRSAYVTITGGGLSQPQTYITSAFGYYAFTDLPTGATYTVQVSTKRFAFAQPTHVINLQGDVTDSDFVADPLP